MSNLHLLCISLDKDRYRSNILNVNDKPGFCKFLFRHTSHSTIETPVGPHRSRVKMRNLLFESGNSVVARQTAAFRHFKSCESALKKDKLQSEKDNFCMKHFTWFYSHWITFGGLLSHLVLYLSNLILTRFFEENLITRPIWFSPASFKKTLLLVRSDQSFKTF